MNRKSLGKQIQKYRERAGYSQEKLAEIIECSTIFIFYIERGVKLQIPVDWCVHSRISGAPILK